MTCGLLGSYCHYPSLSFSLPNINFFGIYVVVVINVCSIVAVCGCDVKLLLLGRITFDLLVLMMLFFGGNRYPAVHIPTDRMPLCLPVVS